MLMTSIIPTTIDENDGFIITRPRRALNQSSRPRTAKAIGVVARAMRAAIRASALTGSAWNVSTSLEITTDPFLRESARSRAEKDGTTIAQVQPLIIDGPRGGRQRGK